MNKLALEEGGSATLVDGPLTKYTCPSLIVCRFVDEEQFVAVGKRWAEMIMNTGK